jgi:DnaJ-class molecular chaperone
MEEEKIRFDMEAVCEGCGKKGAFVYYTGETFCLECMGIKLEIVEKEKE